MVDRYVSMRGELILVRLI